MVVEIVMVQTICIANQKGGVGKTTTAINLSAALAVSSVKTLLVDCDPQANATTGIGLDKAAMEQTLYHGLIGEASASTLIVDTEIKQLKMIPARTELIGFDVEMMSTPDRETIMKHFLDQIRQDFDFIILDCPPSLSLLTLNAITAADEILIPLQSEFYALEGLGQLLQTIKGIKRRLNSELKIAGILLTMFDKRTNLSHQVAEEAEKYFKDLIFNTKIPRNVRLSEAPGFGKPIFLYDEKSVGARHYLDLAQEIIKR
jgi:chromosome partitioning protein